jgi:hypothetical protein
VTPWQHNESCAGCAVCVAGSGAPPRISGHLLTPYRVTKGSPGGRGEAENRTGSRLRRLRGRLRRPVGLCRDTRKQADPFTPTGSWRTEHPNPDGQRLGPRCTTATQMTAGVRAFSLTSRITQRDGTTGRDALGSRPSRTPATRNRTGRLHRDVHGRPAACRNPGLLDDPGLASVSRPRIARGPQSPGRQARPSRSPVPSPAASGRPGRAPVHPLRRDPRSAPTARGTVPVRQARRTRTPAPRQSRKTLSAAEAVDGCASERHSSGSEAGTYAGTLRCHLNLLPGNRETV